MLIKILLRTALIIVLTVIVIGIVACSYLALNGRKLILSEIEKNLGVKAQIASVSVSFPPALIVDDLAIQNSIKIDRLIVSPSLLSLIKGDVILNTVVIEKPVFQVTRNNNDTFDFCNGIFKKVAPVGAPAARPSAQPRAMQGEKAKPRKFYLGRLNVKGAEIEFIDNGTAAAAEPFKMRFANVNLDVFHPVLFNFYRMQFKGQGDMLSVANDKIGKLAISGWVDILAKDMNANVALLGAQLIHFRPYYYKFLKRGLSSGNIDVTALLISKNNDMTADCHLELNNLAFLEQEAPALAQDTIEHIDFTLLAVNSLLSSEGKVVFDFSFRTKMDRPRFEKIKIKGSFLQSAIQSAMSKPPQQTINDFKAIGEQFESIGKEFKKAFKSQ